MLKKIFQSCLTHPLARDINIDSPDAMALRKRIMLSKPFLKSFYLDCYNFICEKIPMDGDGIVLEIGSGPGFLKKLLPGLVTSEILNVSTVDIILDAQTLPLKRNCLGAIVMVDVFHHLPAVTSFLDCASLCVRPGGTIVMVEPWITPWSHFVYRYFHHEPLDMKAVDWTFPANGPLSGANSALPWIVFKRDRKKFENDFSEWIVEEIKLDYPFTYLASGGLSFRSFLPFNFFGILRRFEIVLQPIMGIFALFAKITLRRRERLN